MDNKTGGDGTGGDAKRSLFVHPLAIASICDHHTRVAMGGSLFKKTDPAVGLLFGTQSGLDVEIIDATDAIYSVSDSGEVSLDMVANFPDPTETENKRDKVSLVIAPFEYMNYELLGWYTLADGNEPPEWCTAVHTKIKQANEAPLFLLMNHTPDPNSKHMPLAVFETETHTSTLGDNQESVESFSQVPFQLKSTQCESISVDQITKQGPADGVSILEVQNQTLITSLKILSSKVDTIIKGLKEMENVPSGVGPAATNPLYHHLLRKVNKICYQLPAVDSTGFEKSFQNEMMDNLLTSYLGAATHTSASLNEVSELFAQVFDRRGGHGHKMYP